MKLFRATAIGLLFAINVLNAQGVAAESMPAGVIKFAQNPDGSGDSCGLPFVTSRVDFRSDEHRCVNDQMTYFRLEGVPSASVFRLESESCNASDAKWYFELKTYIQPVSTEWLSIPALKSAAVDEIITRGVILVKKKINTSVPYQGKLSCVDIRRSLLP